MAQTSPQMNSHRHGVLAMAFLCLILADATALLWWGALTFVEKDLDRIRADHPQFTTPPPTAKTPWHSPHMTLLIAEADEYDQFQPTGANIDAPVHVDDIDDFKARLRNAAARNGWYARTTDDHHKIILAVPAQHIAALDGLASEPISWLERTAQPQLPKFDPTQGVRTYTVTIDLNGHSPTLYATGLTAVILLLLGSVTTVLGIFAGTSAWKAAH